MVGQQAAPNISFATATTENSWWRDEWRMLDAGCWMLDLLLLVVVAVALLIRTPQGRG
jgi:hypothetical protein